MFRFLPNAALVLTVIRCICCIKLNDVTVEFFRSDSRGIVAAFGDFDGDKMTDIFVLDESGL